MTQSRDLQGTAWRLSWRRLLVLLAVAALSFFIGAMWGNRLFGHTIPRPSLTAETPAPGPRPARRLPAEFETKAALILGCTDLLDDCPRVFADVVAATYRSTRLIGLVAQPREAEMARRILTNCDLPETAVHFIVLPLETMWARDYGPLFVQRADGSAFIASVKRPLKPEFRRRYLCDTFVSKRLGELLGVQVTPVPLYMVGGNFLTNGEGICVTTTNLAAYNSLNGYEEKDVGALLGKHFGMKQWLTVPRLDGEGTGHVDMFMTFLAPDVVVVAQSSPSVDPENAKRLDMAAALLAEQRTSRGPMRVYRVPMPPRIGDCWRTYTNVAFANGTLLVPVFSGVDQAAQRRVLDLYSRLMPGWKVAPIQSDALVPRRGLLHCITREVPDFVSLEKLGLNGPPATAGR